MDIFINKSNTPTELCSIMKKYGSDKGCPENNGWHNYTLYYHELFQNIKNEKLRIFELGLGTNNINLPSNMGINGKPGASLKGWKEYFPNSLIYGADIDKDILFEEERIKTYYCDQTNKEVIKNLWNNEDLKENFDIIIDDGLHKFSANITFFENSIKKLKKNGVYIIEDIRKDELNLFKDKIEEYKNINENLEFNINIIPHSNNFDNTLIIIKKI
jgi:hypothetical protein